MADKPIGCARPTGGPVGESQKPESTNEPILKKETKKLKSCP